MRGVGEESNTSGLLGPNEGRFRKNAGVNAFRWDGDFDALNAWLDKLGYEAGNDPMMWQEGDSGLGVLTREGPLVYPLGYWVIESVMGEGEFHGCAPDVFAKTYERLGNSLRSVFPRPSSSDEIGAPPT